MRRAVLAGVGLLLLAVATRTYVAHGFPSLAAVLLLGGAGMSLLIRSVVGYKVSEVRELAYPILLLNWLVGFTVALGTTVFAVAVLAHLVPAKGSSVPPGILILFGACGFWYIVIRARWMAKAAFIGVTKKQRDDGREDNSTAT